jgi:prolyl oligopeptidase
MKSVVSGLCALMLTAGVAAAADDDPFAWLEEVDSPRAMAWVEAQNARARERLEGDPRYPTYLSEARAIFAAEDRIPIPRLRAGGVDNLWQDAERPHGVWRHASLASYRKASPQWRTLLDLDALAEAEGRNWFFHGATCLKPAETRCLIALSDGGGDAVEFREFDAGEASFVDGGFRFAEGKQDVAWLDADTLIVGREWTPGEVTTSGYPYVLKTVRRDGTATEVFRGDPTDVSASAIVLRAEGGAVDGIIAARGLTFFESEFSLLTDAGPLKLPLPRRATYQAYVDGRAVFTLQEPHEDFAAGALVGLPIGEFRRAPEAAKLELIFQPSERQAITETAETKGSLVVSILDEVKGAVDVWRRQDGRWAARRLPLPDDASVALVSASGKDETLFLITEGFLSPDALWLADAGAAAAETVKTLPARFDVDGLEIQQFWATSTDGARIPYFVVAKKGLKHDGSTPTLLYGYGGFEIAQTPAYRPELGKIWLERGGAYVLANIRGGGEFGPTWHQAALRENRQRAFDDFAAVAKDLIARKITSPRRLGIYGRSNGGVLTSVSMTQNPQLFNAVVIESPLIDMLRYHRLPAGASWIGEYGDPEAPEDRAFIAAYSAYQKLAPDADYPEPYITTNTRDDRVHPGHARKFAARLEALGKPHVYFENTFGGHANATDPELNAQRWARHYVYLTQRLMD